ncbi:MAG: hypothetical protein KY433_01565 [Actinobacteria bacterium]|nr:hypothetical protein [Actinomycetota bacterium]
MTVLLAGLGVALVALGALVLLRYPDRPGGNVRLLGLEVSSVGAGLPLVALGVLAIAIGVMQEREPSAARDGAGVERPEAAALPGGEQDESDRVRLADETAIPRCISEFFARSPAVPPGRQRFLPRRDEWIVVLKENEPKAAEFGLVLRSRGQVIGAAKMRFDADGEEFLVDGLVDNRCRRAPWSSSGDPATPSPSVVRIHDDLVLALGGATYTIRFHEGAPRTVMELTGG